MKSKPHFKYKIHVNLWYAYDYKYRKSGVPVAFGLTLGECKDAYYRVICGMTA